MGTLIWEALVVAWYALEAVVRKALSFLQWLAREHEEVFDALVTPPIEYAVEKGWL